VREIVDVLQRNYCGHVGLEYMHINDVEERRFLQGRMEGKDAEIVFTPEGKQSILGRSAASSRAGWRARTPRSSSRPRASSRS